MLVCLPKSTSYDQQFARYFDLCSFCTMTFNLLTIVKIHFVPYAPYVGALVKTNVGILKGRKIKLLADFTKLLKRDNNKTFC